MCDFRVIMGEQRLHIQQVANDSEFPVKQRPLVSVYAGQIVLDTPSELLANQVLLEVSGNISELSSDNVTFG